MVPFSCQHNNDGHGIQYRSDVIFQFQNNTCIVYTKSNAVLDIHLHENEYHYIFYNKIHANVDSFVLMATTSSPQNSMLSSSRQLYVDTCNDYVRCMHL